MPIYEYRCQNCGMTIELLQKMGSSAAGVVCPTCNSPELTKIISAHAVTKNDAANQVNSGGCDQTPICGGSCCGGNCHGH